MGSGTIQRQKELWLLAASPFVLAAILISSLVPAANYVWISSRAKTQNELLTSIVEYRSLLSALDESTRAVILAPDRSDLRDRRKESVQALKEHLEKMIEFSPGEGPISQDLLLLASHLRKEVEARSAEVERYSRAPGEWAMRRFHKEYATARAQHAAIVQDLSNEARAMVQRALWQAQYRILVSLGILLLAWSAAAAFAAGKVRLRRVSVAPDAKALPHAHGLSEASHTSDHKSEFSTAVAPAHSTDAASGSAASEAAHASADPHVPSAAPEAADPAASKEPPHPGNEEHAPASAASAKPAEPEKHVAAADPPPSSKEEVATPAETFITPPPAIASAAVASPTASAVEAEKAEDFMPPGVVDLNAILAAGDSASPAEEAPAESTSGPIPAAASPASGPLSAQALAASLSAPAADPTPETLSTLTSTQPAAAALVNSEDSASTAPSPDTGKFAQVVLPKNSTTEIDLTAPLSTPATEPALAGGGEQVSANETSPTSPVPKTEPDPDPINLETIDPSTMTAEQLTAHLLGGSASSSASSRSATPVAGTDKEKTATSPAAPPKTIRGSDIVAQKSAASGEGSVDLSF